MTIANRRTLLTCLIVFVVSGGTSVAADAAEGLTDGLVAYWPLDDSTDEQIRGHDLQPKQVQTAFADGVVGKSLQSREGNGVHAGLYLHPANKLGLGELKAFTLSTWYRIDSLGGTGEKSAFRHGAGALGWYNPDNNSLYYFTTVYKKRGTEGAHLASLAAGLGTRLGSWHHVVQRVDTQGNHSVWHAVSDSSGHMNDPVASDELAEFESLALAGELAEMPITLAYHEEKGGKDGGCVSADEVAIWNRALSAEEIQWLFLLGRAGHAVTSPVPLDELKPPPSADPLALPRDFGWKGPWQLVPGQNSDHARLQTNTKSTGEMAIAATGLVTIERQFPGVSSGTLKFEFRVRPKHVTVEVNSPGASVMKTYLWGSRQPGSWTMRWHFPWAWPAIGGNTVPRFYVADGGGSKRKGLEYTDMLIESKTWYTVATVLDCDHHTWEFWVDGQKFDTQVNLGRSNMRWWKTSANEVDTLRISTWGWNWIDAFRVYHDDQLIASTDFTSEEGYVADRSIFSFKDVEDGN